MSRNELINDLDRLYGLLHSTCDYPQLLQTVNKFSDNQVDILEENPAVAHEFMTFMASLDELLISIINKRLSNKSFEDYRKLVVTKNLTLLNELKNALLDAPIENRERKINWFKLRRGLIRIGSYIILVLLFINTSLMIFPELSLMFSVILFTVALGALIYFSYSDSESQHVKENIANDEVTEGHSRKFKLNATAILENTIAGVIGGLVLLLFNYFLK